MTSANQGRWLERSMPFVFGIAGALGVFAFFGWDLAHHWVPYSPNRHNPAFQWLVTILLWLIGFMPTAHRWLRRRQSRN